MPSKFKAVMELSSGLGEGWRSRDAKEPHGSKEPSFLWRSVGRFFREAQFKTWFWDWPPGSK